MRIFQVLLLFLLVVNVVNAQRALTIDDAISITLKNNFEIQVLRNDASIAKVNNTAGNAGMLPKVAVVGAGNYSLTNQRQELSSGLENHFPSLSTTALSAGAELTWTLYDGGKMFVTKRKLSEIQTLGEIQFKEKVLTKLYSVIAAYYGVVCQKQLLGFINQELGFNQERLGIANARFKAGSLLRTDVLMAMMDLNVSNEKVINQSANYEAAQRELNVLMGQNTELGMVVSDSIPLNYSPNKKMLIEKLNSSNASILSFQKQIEIAQLAVKENKSLYLPTVGFKGGYYASQTHNSAGSVTKNTSIGPQLGGTVVLPIYSSGENKRKLTTAKIQLQSSEYELENIKAQVNAEFENTYTDFENQLSLLGIEKNNNSLAAENIKISLERLRLGQTTSLEVRIAEDDYVQSCTRLINFQYSYKLAETRLKQLVADLWESSK